MTSRGVGMTCLPPRKQAISHSSAAGSFAFAFGSFAPNFPTLANLMLLTFAQKWMSMKTGRALGLKEIMYLSSRQFWVSNNCMSWPATVNFVEVGMWTKLKPWWPFVALPTRLIGRIFWASGVNKTWMVSSPKVCLITSCWAEIHICCKLGIDYWYNKYLAVTNYY